MVGNTRNFILLLLVCGGSVAFAQKADSATAAKTMAADIQFLSGSDIANYNGGLQGIDTSLVDFENYNPVYKSNANYAYTGNLGSPAFNLIFALPTTIGIDAGYKNQFPLFSTAQTIRYFRTPSPYTELSYSNAQLKEQFLAVTHAQNVTKRFSVGINFNRIDAVGYYKQQRVNYLGFNAITWFQSRNARYNVYSNFIINRLRWQENGEVQNDSLFEAGRQNAGELEEVNFLQAQNKLKLFEVNITQTFDFGSKDSVKVGKKNFLKFTPRTRILYAVQASSNQSNYTDKLPVRRKYGNLYDFGADTTQVLDSFAVSFFSQNLRLLSVNTNDTTPQRFGYSVGISQQGVKYTAALSQQSTYLINIGYSAKIEYRPVRNISLYAETNNTVKNLADLQKNENSYESGIVFSPKQHRLRAAYTYSTNAPDFYFAKRYNAGNVPQLYVATLQKSKQYQVSYQAIRYKMGIAANSYQIENYQYWQRSTDSAVLSPAYINSITTVNQISGYKNFNIWRFGLDNSATYQQTNQPVLLHLPEWFLHHSLYYNGVFFKVLTVKLGLDLRYSTTFVPPSYSGIGRTFYTQNDIAATATYPVIDVFAVARLKRVRLLLKMDHLSQGWFGYDGYFTVKGYPMPTRALKFSLSWKFYD